MILLYNGCALMNIQMWKMGETTCEVSNNKNHSFEENEKTGNQ